MTLFIQSSVNADDWIYLLITELTLNHPHVVCQELQEKSASLFEVNVLSHISIHVLFDGNEKYSYEEKSFHEKEKKAFF